MELKQITVIGTGLIGGSFGLAIKRHGFRGRVIGCDREAVLDLARKMGAIDRGIPDPQAASAGSDVVLLATPVGTIIDLIERLGPVLPPSTLLTDTGSTKREITARARAVFGQDTERRFLAGHPMAGKEYSGIDHASADLFSGATWIVTRSLNAKSGETATKPAGEHSAASDFLALISGIGAHLVYMDVEHHDRVCAWVSHLPQMLSTALAATLADEPLVDGEALELAGRALRDVTRLASSPYSMWRDIALTNSANIQEALLRLEQRLAHLRENLRSAELREEFERANNFRVNGPGGLRANTSEK